MMLGYPSTNLYLWIAKYDAWLSIYKLILTDCKLADGLTKFSNRNKKNNSFENQMMLGYPSTNLYLRISKYFLKLSSLKLLSCLINHLQTYIYGLQIIIYEGMMLGYPSTNLYLRIAKNKKNNSFENQMMLGYPSTNLYLRISKYFLKLLSLKLLSCLVNHLQTYTYGFQNMMLSYPSTNLYLWISNYPSTNLYLWISNYSSTSLYLWISKDDAWLFICKLILMDCKILRVGGGNKAIIKIKNHKILKKRKIIGTIELIINVINFNTPQKNYDLLTDYNCDVIKTQIYKRYSHKLRCYNIILQEKDASNINGEIILNTLF
ncbi:hypothetical protein H8356DRAFT_1325270 [Neocallimastix lanati (nom. inval.)]|nr:hypothetical protein H8356DRAFT_1325270 [Neocallimastix sp. JGI-2020a]